MRRQLFLAGVAIGGALAACSDSEPAAPKTTQLVERPKLVVLDASNGGNAAFRWLPPFTATADNDGALNASASPTITVCNWLPAGCQVVASSGSAGFPSPWIAGGKKGAADYYTTSWNTKSAALDPAKEYKAFVLVGGVIQGYADLKVVPTYNDLPNVPAGFVGVVAGSALEINFRIRTGLTRTWKGGSVEKGKNADQATATQWANAANWVPEGVPFLLDTVVIAATQYQPALPLLPAITRVHSVSVADGAILPLGAARLTVSGNVKTVGAGKITATTGVLELAGVGSVAGTLPSTWITGQYILAGNVTLPTNLSVLGGNVVNYGFNLTISR